MKLWFWVSTFNETFIVQEHTASETAGTLLIKFSKAGTQVTCTEFEQVDAENVGTYTKELINRVSKQQFQFTVITMAYALLI